MRGFVERRDLQLLAIRRNRVVEFSLLLQFRRQILVRALMKRVDSDLFAKRENGIVVPVEPGIRSSQIIPRILLARVLLGRALQQISGGAKISALHSRHASLV